METEKSLFKSKAESLSPKARSYYHTIEECNLERTKSGHLLNFMDHVTEVPIYEDGSGGCWSVFSHSKPKGWKLHSSFGFGSVCYHTHKWELVLEYLDAK